MTITALAAFLGGVLTLFAPCAAMLLPSFFAYAFVSRSTLLARTAVFTLAVVTVLVPLGAFAATLGHLIRAHTTTITLIAGLVVIALGVAQVFSLSLPTPKVANQLMTKGTSTGGPQTVGAGGVEDRKPTALAVFALGAGYALAGVGCSGPILGAALSAAALTGSAWQGGLLMAAFALGMALPVGLLALVWEGLRISERSWLRPSPVKVLGRWSTWQNLISGIIFIVLGVILVAFGGNTNLPSLLSADAQINLETRIIHLTNSVPSIVVILLAVVLVGLVVVWVKERQGPKDRH
ncbi:MAG: cytochrome c biogenesis CcdA family protein [Actinomycetaceae bacterium]|nr:cytochrome c biogenesis CcdA family protein [Actinomycetaceae bacterium]